MFGYITVNQPELRFREFDLYRSYYCGLCRTLKRNYGISGQMTLSYDTTFLLFLLTQLYEPEDAEGTTRCAAHPLEKHPTRTNEFTDYAAAVNVILSYYSCLDDWQDEKSLRKLLFSRLLRSGEARASAGLERKVETVTSRLAKLRGCEEAGETDIDLVSGLFGEILSELFAPREDEWASTLRRMGFYLGKFIYILDAYDDLEKDRKNGNYNPLMDDSAEEGFDERIRQILTMMMAECCRSFETLPIIRNTEILRNILYSGVWTRFEQIRAERKGQSDV